MSGAKRYVRVYQAGQCVRSCGGEQAFWLIKDFFDKQNPTEAIRRDYYKEYIGEKTEDDPDRVLMFPSQFKHCPQLVGYKEIYHKPRSFTRTRNYSGLIYLVEIQRRKVEYRRIRNIYVAEYIDGRLNSLTKMHPTNKIWFKKDQIEFVDVKPGKATMYTCTAYGGIQSTKIDLVMDKHIIITDDTSSKKKDSDKSKVKIHTSNEEKYMTRKHPIMTLCGSTRFKENFLEAEKEFGLHGYIVLSVVCYSHADGLYETGVINDTIKIQLDELHKRKIDMSDCICVVNCGDYIGESTKSEIAYAKSLGKTVMYYYPHKE